MMTSPSARRAFLCCLGGNYVAMNQVYSRTTGFIIVLAQFTAMSFSVVFQCTVKNCLRFRFSSISEVEFISTVTVGSRQLRRIVVV
jgi:hypothetical protein